MSDIRTLMNTLCIVRDKLPRDEEINTLLVKEATTENLAEFINITNNKLLTLEKERNK